MENSAPNEGGLGPVVVGVDGSEHSDRAAVWAAAEAEARGRPLTVVHGVGAERQGYWTPDEAEAVITGGGRLLDHVQSVVAERYPGLPVATTLSRSDPAAALLEAGGAEDTLVVGSRGRGGFASLLLGSVSLRVAARSRGPVVVVRAVPEDTTGTVVAAVRDDGDRETVRFAARTAARRGAVLRVVSVWRFLENVGSMGAVAVDIDAVARSEVEATRRTVGPIRAEFPDLTITEDAVRSRSVAAALVDASASADLLVMGARRRAHVMGVGLGGVTHAVLHHAHCPVAVLPRR
ncbi:universal stress protein [Streptomyces sp. NPDC020983]|uniref:universal stress protein n=1 Tax=Streptomyces sp. NPDC020983 TaxID=3365106 RepID=UPI00378E6C97